MTAIIHALMLHRELITRNQMIYLIVDNRKPEAVPHWPAFAAWWASRRCLVGPQEEATDVLWVCADNTSLLLGRSFVLEAARFLYPKQHFALIDNDCVPVTLFEAQDLIELAHQQLQWVDLIGHARAEADACRGRGMLLFTEAHLEYNAGLVISIGRSHKSSPLEGKPTSATLAKELHAYRLALVSRARPPITPSETAIKWDHVYSLCWGPNAKCPRPVCSLVIVWVIFFPRVRTPCGRSAQVIIERKGNTT